MNEFEETIATLQSPAATGTRHLLRSFEDNLLDRIRLRSRRRIMWLRMLWMKQEEYKPASSHFTVHAEVDGYLTSEDSILAEQEWQSQDESILPLNEELATIDEYMQAEQVSRFARLKEVLELTEDEADILQCCLALCIDPNLGRVYAYLHDHSGRGYVSSQLVARLFGHGSYIVIGSSSPLSIWGLIKQTDMGKSEPAMLELDPFIRNWLLGCDDLDPAIVNIAWFTKAVTPLPDWPIKSIAATIHQSLHRKRNEMLRLFIGGQPGTGRKSMATAVCTIMERQTLVVECNGFSRDNWEQVFMRAQRQALLGNYILLWEGDAAIENTWRSYPKMEPVQFLVGEPDEAPQPSTDIIDLRVDMPSIQTDSALRLWNHFIPASCKWPSEEIISMTRRHQINIGHFVSLSKRFIQTPAQASDELRSLSRQRLGDLAKQISSDFTWNDLVIPASLRNNLHDFYFEATERSSLWEQPATRRLFPQGRGLMALFTGTPGTGKTMAAQVIANSLQLDLFRIDLSSLISKYIGETSKNIQRVLSRAARMDVVLLFDEADALFGKRTDMKDAQDRYANSDTNFLLQAIEEYPGIAILASNRKTNIDTGFMRRLRYILDFPKPGLPERMLLWNNLVTELAGVSLSEIELKKLAETVDATGAQIKLSVLSAVYMSRRDKKDVTLAYLLRGLERELGKEGRGLNRHAQDLIKYYSNNEHNKE